MKPETFTPAGPVPVTVPLRGITRRQLTLLAAALALIIATGLSGAYWYRTGRYIETTDDAYVGGDVTEISPHVNGFIETVEVADNQAVKAGDLLVRIAAPDFKATTDHAAAVVQERIAALQSLQARIALQHSLIEQKQAELTARRDSEAFAKRDAERFASLARTQAVSGRAAEQSRTTSRTAKSAVTAAAAEVEAARQQLAVLESAVAGANAALAQARAELQTAQLNLGYTEIRSPIDGYVGNRSAQVGAYVTAGTHLLSIVPAHGLWVDANFKEDQIRQMRPGKPATVVLDVMPGREFHGRVVSLAPATGAVFSVIPAQNATGNFTKIVQRLPVRIVIEDGAAARLLRPGLSTTVSVNTHPQAGDAS